MVDVQQLVFGTDVSWVCVCARSFFTYDSYDYIQHLSDALTASTGEPAIDWATREFAEKIGVPDLFLFDNVSHGGYSAGGGQLMTCRDLARVGTLLVNGGEWAAEDGSSFQLLSKDYVRQQLTPSYPVRKRNGRPPPNRQNCPAQLTKRPAPTVSGLQRRL